jgi:hypothetical protein
MDHKTHPRLRVPSLALSRSQALRLLALLPLLLLSACAGYHLGPTNGLHSGERSIQITPFVNQTLEPRLSDNVTLSLRKNLQKDGTYRLNTQNEGDIIVSGAVVNYDRIQLAFQSTDVVTATQYRIVITAQVTARERLTGKVVLNRKVSGQSTTFVGSDLPSAERQTLPLAADDLARNITGLLVDGDW